jgi:Ca2+-binding RTX toxin-like protein
MANFTPQEQLMLELINRGRMDPNAEAKRYGISLNEGVPSSKTISTSPKEVLAGNDAIAAAADNHNGWLIANDQLSHVETSGTPGFTGAMPADRMSFAGYTGFNSKENIGYKSGSNTTQNVYDLHRMLFVDAGVDGRGHRVNLMAGNIREAGIGVATGNFSGSNVTMVTQDFALKVAIFITGVVYNDTTSNNNFFDVGEEQAGVGVTSTESASDTTGAGGGYELQYTSLDNPTKTVTFDLPTGDFVADVTFGTTNIKLDVVNGNEIWTNAKSLTSLSTTVKELHALGISKVKLNGSDANEKIFGNSADNKLTGGGGKDSISAGAGNDKINGGAGKDTQAGGSGNDKFVFTAASDSTVSKPDLLKDFGDSGTDKISLSALGDLTYRDEAAINGANQVSVSQSGSDVIVHVNLNADLADEMRIVLDNTTLSSMSAADFIL